MTVIPTPRTAHTYAYEALRARILSGDLAPGSPLVQHNLAQELGVSMTPVREALRDLATEGLITISPHRGATVTQLDFTDASEVYRIRLLLEPTAAMLAVPDATTELLDRADVLIREMAAVTGPAWVSLNLEFHSLMLSPLKSPRLLSILRSLQEAGTLYVSVAIGQRVAMPTPESEHVAILDAYRRRDAAGAAAAVAEHLRSSLKALEPEHHLET
jgi:DNA-binding GntR family transcriptional regulator